MADVPVLRIAAAPTPPAQALERLLRELTVAFPLPENAAYLSNILGGDSADKTTARPVRILCERVSALSLLPPLLRGMGMDTAALVLGRDSAGRPHLMSRSGDRPPDINLSHTRTYVACACVPSPYRVGVDVEEHVPALRAERLVARFCTEEERALLSGYRSFPGIPLSPVRNGFRPDFTCIWTIREAISKYVGTGEPLRFDAAAPPSGVRLISGRLGGDGAQITLCFSGDITAPPILSPDSPDITVDLDLLIP